MSKKFSWQRQPGNRLWREQLQAVQALYAKYAARFPEATKNGDRSERLAWASRILGHRVESFSALSVDEAGRLIDLLKGTLGQELGSRRQQRRRRPGRDRAYAYGTAGRCDEVTKEIALVDAETLKLLDHLVEQLGWTRERLDAFLHSAKSPVRSGSLRTLAEANRVIWALKNMLRRQKTAASDASLLRRAG